MATAAIDASELEYRKFRHYGILRPLLFCLPPPEADRRSKSFSEFSVGFFLEKVRILFGAC